MTAVSPPNCRLFDASPVSTAGLWLLCHGREAEIWVTRDSPSTIIKRWNKGVRVSGVEQFRLLRAVYNSGLPVPQPLGWGFDQHNHHLLAMRYAGRPVRDPTEEQMVVLARLLASIHATSPPPDVPEHDDDFWRRNLRGIEPFPDLVALAAQLSLTDGADAVGLTHGDFHPGNVVMEEEDYTVIDWSSSRVGDRLYDLAWSDLILRIYYGQPRRDAFMREYRALAGPFDPELYARRMLAAGLRWLVLARTAPVPIEAAHLDAAVDVVERTAARLGIRGTILA